MAATHFFPLVALANRRSGGLGLLAVGAAGFFVLGLATGAIVRPTATPAVTVANDLGSASPAPRSAPVYNSAYNSTLAYPADVIRVIDGDTFEARVRVWPGLSVDTKVRLRNIDAPELYARCADELAKAQAARAALEKMLAAGGITIAQVGVDKYGGRVDAVVATRDIADISAALLSSGFARNYSGGRRGSWC
jgi:endonuclease YncB( thermonuclease family)